jgi:hypothetical protein
VNWAVTVLMGMVARTAGLPEKSLAMFEITVQMSPTTGFLK